MSKHTATPWRIGTGNFIVADAPAPGIDGSDATHYYGGHMICESVNAPNAAHIVRCVNNFDALVGALEAILAHREFATLQRGSLFDLRERARAALAAVKEAGHE